MGNYQESFHQNVFAAEAYWCLKPSSKINVAVLYNKVYFPHPLLFWTPFFSFSLQTLTQAESVSHTNNFTIELDKLFFVRFVYTSSERRSIRLTGYAEKKSEIYNNTSANIISWYCFDKKNALLTLSAIVCSTVLYIQTGIIAGRTEWAHTLWLIVDGQNASTGGWAVGVGEKWHFLLRG